MGKLKQKISTFLSIAIFLAPILSITSPVRAVSSSDFLGSNLQNSLISNTDFLDVNSMSQDDIQNFLNNHNSYIKDYSENGRPAAQIIHEAAHGLYDAAGSLNGITINESTGTVSPKVLLVMLDKEQSLIGRTTRNDWAMIASLGYYCYPGVIGDNNNNGCKDSFEGFTKQVENGAWQLRYNYERAQGKGLDYQVGQNFATSDGYSVILTNAATSSLYRYTPYVFNGNYNFYNFFTGWFSVHSDVEINDTTKFTLKTYETSQTISGQKASASIAYLDGQQIAGVGTRTWQIALSNIATGTNEHAITYKDGGGTLVGTKQIIIVVQKAGDVNGDGGVSIQDLSIFANYWNQTNPEEPLADLNGDHVVNIQDLSILAGYWGS